MNFVRNFSLPKPVPGCTYAVFRLAVLRSRAGQLDYNTTRTPLCQHLFSIFSTNFSPPFWALCILLSAARRTTRGGFLGAGGGGLRPHGVFIARNVPGCGNAPRAAGRPPLHPMVNRTIRRERRACRNVPAAGSRPRPTNFGGGRRRGDRSCREWTGFACLFPHSVGRGLDPAVRFFLCPQRS